MLGARLPVDFLLKDFKSAPGTSPQSSQEQVKLSLNEVSCTKDGEIVT